MFLPLYNVLDDVHGENFEKYYGKRDRCVSLNSLTSVSADLNKGFSN